VIRDGGIAFKGVILKPDGSEWHEIAAEGDNGRRPPASATRRA